MWLSSEYYPILVVEITYIDTKIIGKPQQFVHCYIFIVYLLIFIFPNVN